MGFSQWASVGGLQSVGTSGSWVSVSGVVVFSTPVSARAFACSAFQLGARRPSHHRPHAANPVRQGRLRGTAAAGAESVGGGRLRAGVRTDRRSRRVPLRPGGRLRARLAPGPLQPDDDRLRRGRGRDGERGCGGAGGGAWR